MTELKHFRRNKFIEDSMVSSAVMQIKIERIRPNRSQPRAEFDNNSIIRLADSMRRYGILQPLTVRASSDDAGYDYELIAGERRLRAARLLGYYTVPCVIIEADERMSAEMAIIENLLREDLNMFEEAYAFRQLIDNYGLTQEEVARKMSLSQSAVANKIRLLKLSYEEQRMILEAELTERHARALLKIDDPELRKDIIREISASKMNVVTTEQYIDNLLNKVSGEEKKAKAHKEKSARDMINKFKSSIDSFKKLGKEASIDIAEKEDEIEVYIKIKTDQCFT